MSDDQKLKKSDASGAFTVDPEGSGLNEMPSITALLQRKSMGLGKTSLIKRKIEGTQSSLFLQRTPKQTPSEAPLALRDDDKTVSALEVPVVSTATPPTPPAVTSLSVSIQSEMLHLPKESGTSGTARIVQAAAPVVQKAARRSFQDVQSSLTIWTDEKLKSNPDPLAKGILNLLQNGGPQISSILFLSIAHRENSIAHREKLSSTPLFISSAAVHAAQRLTLWTGLKWDPVLIPEVWNEFVRTGFVEFLPPGTVTNLQSTRNVLRGAFGLTKSEVLTLIRVGPAEGCRGVIALVSNGPIKSLLPEALTYISAPLSKKAA